MAIKLCGDSEVGLKLKTFNIYLDIRALYILTTIPKTLNP
jgi:hypothetical protein